MKRIAEALLATWADGSGRKPLALHGARQTGKTWLIKHVGEQFHGGLSHFLTPRQAARARASSMELRISSLIGP